MSLPSAVASPARMLLGAILYCFFFGAFYAWSVLVVPLEAALGVSRTTISSGYSVSIVSFTLAVLVSDRALPLASSAMLAAGSCFLGAIGLIGAWLAASLAGILIGYGVILGFANGFGYAVALHIIATSGIRRTGLATGAVVGAYAAGGVLLSPVFQAALTRLSPFETLGGFGLVMAIVGLATGWLLKSAPASAATPARAAAAPSETPARDQGERGLIARLWAGYVLGAFSGLMAVGHAAPIIVSLGGAEATAVLGPSLISLGNGIGRLCAGFLADVIPLRLILAGAPALTGASMALMLILPVPAAALLALASIGLAYGFMATCYPVTVARLFGAERRARVFGRVFTAWGVAGLSAPLIAGAVFEATGSYATAFAIALIAAAGSAAACWLLPRA